MSAGQIMTAAREILCRIFALSVEERGCGIEVAISTGLWKNSFD